MIGTTTTEAANPRRERGLALYRSRHAQIRHVVGDKYVVPSATSDADYIVDVEARRCSCPDHQERLTRCKHLWAVSYFRSEVEMPDGTTVVTETVAVERKTYAQPSWAAYNAAQCEEVERAQVLLRSLCDGIQGKPPSKLGGRPRIPLGDAIFGATMKVYGGMSGRRSMSALRACERDGMVEKAPSFSSLFRCMEDAEMMPLLRHLVEESAKPLRAVETCFAVDGTGFGTNTYVRHFDYAHGKDRRMKQWVKAHANIGVLTNAIVTVEITGGHDNDSPEFAALIERAHANGFKIAEVSADKAYLSNKNLTLVETVGGVPFVPFKSDSTCTHRHSPAWQRMWAWFTANRDDFMRHYHLRSNVESTFSSIKRKFGAGVRSKTLDAQVNEVLIKCLCHNLACLVHAIHDLHIDPKFWMPSSPAPAAMVMAP